jgi:transcriptional regulator with XRE-family HTH domain
MEKARDQIARNIRAAIAEAGITQAELAKKLHAGPGAVGNWGQGLTVPSLENLILIALEVRQSVSWLVGDALHGFDTLERFERDLAVRLGGERLRALADVSDADLLPQIDLLIRSRPAPSEMDAVAPKSARPTRLRRK